MILVKARVTWCIFLLIAVTPLFNSVSLISAILTYQTHATDSIPPASNMNQYSLDVYHPPALPGPPYTRYWYDSGTYTRAVTNSPTYDRSSPGRRYVFTHWSGDATSTETTSDPILIDGPKIAQPNWKTQFEVDFDIIPKGAGTVTPASGDYYKDGTMFLIRAEANPGYVFSSWTNAFSSEIVSTETETTIKVEYWTVLNANFNRVSSDSVYIEFQRGGSNFIKAQHPGDVVR